MFLLLSILSVSKKIGYDCEKCQKKYAKLAEHIHNTTIDTNFSFCKGSKKCNKMTSKLQNKLKDLVTSHDICESLGKCRPKAKPLSQTVPRKASSSITLHESQDNCEFCQSLIEYLTGEGLYEVSVPIFTNFLMKICTNLKVIEPICNHLNEHHVQNLIHFITSHYDTSELCEVADFCQSS